MSAILKPTKTLVPIKDWAEAVFPTKPPHRNTLRNWIKDGRILPRPKKVGKNWFVSPNAEYQED